MDYQKKPDETIDQYHERVSRERDVVIVADKSQPVKIVLMVVGLLGAALFGWIVLDKIESRPLGFSLSEPDIATSTIVESSMSCGNASSTQIVVAQPGRTGFFALNNSTNTIYLCRSNNCTATGTPLYAVGSTTLLGKFTQTDAYTGLYTCFATVGTSTLVFGHSQ